MALGMGMVMDKDSDYDMGMGKDTSKVMDIVEVPQLPGKNL